jgi:hypothetical protein
MSVVLGVSMTILSLNAFKPVKIYLIKTRTMEYKNNNPYFDMIIHCMDLIVISDLLANKKS